MVKLLGASVPQIPWLSDPVCFDSPHWTKEVEGDEPLAGKRRDTGGEATGACELLLLIQSDAAFTAIATRKRP